MNKEIAQEVAYTTCRQLICEVSPELRAVTVEEVEENCFQIVFYYDGEVTEKKLDDYDCVGFEVSCITFETEALLEFENKLVRCDYPKPIPARGILVYYRKEPQDLANIEKFQQEFFSPFAHRGEKYVSLHIRRVMQNALLGFVVPQLRSVGIGWTKEHLYVHFYFDGMIKKEYKKDVGRVMTVFSKYFPSDYVYVRIYQMDYPQPIPFSTAIAYARKEKPIYEIPFGYWGFDSNGMLRKDPPES